MIAVGNKRFFSKIEGDRILLKDLQSTPLILYRRFEKLILSACKAQGVKPVIFCMNDDARTSLMWANAGLGVAIVPQSMGPYSVDSYLGNGDCDSKVIAERSIQSQVTAIWRSDRYLSAAAKGFLEIFKK